jgi:hypothetical protein
VGNDSTGESKPVGSDIGSVRKVIIIIIVVAGVEIYFTTN